MPSSIAGEPKDGEVGASCRLLLTAPGPHALEKGTQGPWHTSRCPRRLDQHTAGMSTSLFGDSPMMCRTGSRLPHARIEAEITDKALRTAEAFGFSDRRHDRECDNHITTWNRHEARHAFIGQC
jgi:hypothetical protein